MLFQKNKQYFISKTFIYIINVFIFVVGMERINSLDFKNNINNDNEYNFIEKKIGKSTDEILRECLSETIKKCKQGASIVLQLPTNNYFQLNISSAKFLIETETSYSIGKVKVKTLGLALFSKLSNYMYSISKFIVASFIPVIAVSLFLLFIVNG